MPGCESIERTGDNEYVVLMTARVGPVSAKFKGRMTLSNIQAPNSYSIAFEGQGGVAGFAKGSADVSLTTEGHDTRLAYKVKANVGGKLAQIGSRLVDAAANKVANDFFASFNEKVGKPAHAEAAEHHDAITRRRCRATRTCRRCPTPRLRSSPPARWWCSSSRCSRCSEH